MNLKYNERKIQLKISLIEGDLIKEITIEVLPDYTIKQVKEYIDSTQNIGPQNFILKKLTDELNDEMIIDQIRRTKKDSDNVLHITARSLVQRSDAMKEENKEFREGN